MARRLVFAAAAVAGLAVAACRTAIELPVLVHFADDREAALVKPLRYVVGEEGETVVVPVGFVTDYASIPRVVWSLLPPNGRYSRAAIVHDYLYWSQGCTRRQADAIFLRAMEDSGVSKTKRATIHRAVVLGGGPGWERNARERASGLPRIVPAAELDRLPPDTVWSEYRGQLRARGIGPEPRIESPAPYCTAADA